jgi:hypothetical protein
MTIEQVRAIGLDGLLHRLCFRGLHATARAIVQFVSERRQELNDETEDEKRRKAEGLVCEQQKRARMYFIARDLVVWCLSLDCKDDTILLFLSQNEHFVNFTDVANEARAKGLRRLVNPLTQKIGDKEVRADALLQLGRPPKASRRWLWPAATLGRSWRRPTGSSTP